MTAARIFSPSKSQMQSGTAKTGHWVLEYERERRAIDPLMGYTSSGDPLSQVSLSFHTREDAIAYAQKHGIEFRVEEPHQSKRRQVAYSDNFRFDRKVPWTH